MNLTVVSEHRLIAAADGSVWGDSGYGFWSRYLDGFDAVRLVCRVQNAATPVQGQVRVDGPGVSICAVPPYLGPEQYLRIRHDVWAAVSQAFTPGSAVILRVGSQLAGIMARRLRQAGAPYGVEVVGDPHEVFRVGVVEHPFRPLFRWWFTRQQQRLCAAACGAAYVTERALQSRYPCGAYMVGVADVGIQADDDRAGQMLVTHFSSVRLVSHDSVDRFRALRGTRSWKLITVGSLAQMYKGVDILLNAVAVCRTLGLDVRLTIVGEGKYRPAIEQLARALGVAEHVRFTGALPGPRAVQEELDAADLFVLASRTEGLPRALVEAMARGLPCIATRVGGVPELLADKYLVTPGSVEQLANLILEVCRNPAWCTEMSRANLAKAKEFRDETVRARRLEFYRHVRSVTATWSTAHGIH